MGCFFSYACFDLTNPSKHCLMSGWVLLSTSAQLGGVHGLSPLGGRSLPRALCLCWGKKAGVLPKELLIYCNIKELFTSHRFC